MAARKVTVGRILEVVSSGRTSFSARDERITIRVHVDGACPREVAECVRDSLLAVREGGVVDVRDMRPPLPGEEAPDAALVLTGEGRGAGLVSAYARAGVSVAAVVEGALEAPRLDLPDQAAACAGVVAASSPEALADKLASWLAGATDKPLALAACFPFCRRAVTDALVSRCAVENAAVGAVSLVPGSDLPVMCTNQAMLALDLAAAYGRDADLSRLAEIAGVVGAGLVWRSLARALVGLVPGIGGVLKAGVGFGGTVATGRALRLRLELEDGPASADRRRGGAAGGGAGDAGARPSFSAPGAGAGAAGGPGGDDGYVTIGEGEA